MDAANRQCMDAHSGCAARHRCLGQGRVILGSLADGLQARQLLLQTSRIMARMQRYVCVLPGVAACGAVMSPSAYQIAAQEGDLRLGSDSFRLMLYL